MATEQQEEKIIAKERRGWALLSGARGPDGMIVPLWSAVLLAVGGADGVCGQFSGHSSGADGLRCTADADWNETLWSDVGGAACTVEQAFGNKYSHNPILDGCADALLSYRLETDYSCNCTGDYAYLNDLGGARISTVIQATSAVCFIVLSLYLPYMGTYMDYCEDRKKPLRNKVRTMVVSLLLMTAVLPNYMWCVSVMAFCALFVSTEACSVIQSTFVKDLSKTEGQMMQLTATGQGIQFAGMFITALISAGLSFAVGTPQNTQWTLVLAAAWGCVGFCAISQLRSRPPTRKREEYESMIAITAREMAALLRELGSDYPECGKYFAALCLANNGIVTFVVVYPTYFTIQQKLTSFDITLISALTVTVASISCFFFVKVAHRFRVKHILSVAVCGWGLVTAFIPFYVYKEGDRTAALMLGFIYGFGLCLYWSTQYAALVLLLPAEKIGKFTGLFSSLKNLTSAFGPALYAAVAQASNNQRLAIFVSLVPFFVLSLVPLYLTDFEKGQADARKQKAPEPALPNMMGQTQAQNAGAILEKERWQMEA